MIQIIRGDCIEKMKELPDNSVDSIVTDPPYELGFMGKHWDETGIANSVEMWREALRVLKPGGHLLAFSGTRTYHRMAVAIEDAGFEVRDMIEWVYGSGFPKSLNIGKAVDKLQGNEREVEKHHIQSQTNPDIHAGGSVHITMPNNWEVTKGTSEWEGWGTALKPAHEPICMARKPLGEKTVAENCLKWGTGGINIDESRVGTDKIMIRGGGNVTKDGEKTFFPSNEINEERTGRFPANLIHDNSEEVRECFPETGKSTGGRSFQTTSDKYGEYANNFTNEDPGFGDSGNASRFFKSIIYQAKSSKSDRNSGGVVKNIHPTCKPTALMGYLIKLVTPKGGTVLDPFMGSGSTGVAAKQNGYGFIGIDMTPEYIEIAKARIGV